MSSPYLHNVIFSFIIMYIAFSLWIFGGDGEKVVVLKTKFFLFNN